MLLLSPQFPGDPVMWASTDNGIRKSTDGGATWQPTGPAGLTELAMSPNYSTDGTVFAGTTAGLFVTRDKGLTWSKLTAAPLGSVRVKAIAVSPNFAADGTVLLSAGGSGLYKSTDGGRTFVATGASLIQSNLVIADYEWPTSAPIQFSPSYAVDRTIFGFAEQNIVKSTDGGATWTVLNLPSAAEFVNPPVVAAAPVQVTTPEGAAGEQRTVRVPFDLSHPYASQVTVDWRTVDQQDPALASAAAGDFPAASGTLVFPRGSTRQFVDVVVNGDTTDEPDEPLVIATSNATNATIGGFFGLGIATIQDDDPLPAVTPGTATVVEGNADTTTISIPVSLTNASSRTITVDWTTLDYQAVAGEDFAAASGTLTFLPGETTQTIDVQVLGDTVVEPDEQFLITTSNPTNARIGGFYGIGVGTIQNDDEEPPPPPPEG
jgi:hypothetical protein